ncbi:Uu.00g042600.m01.CDS01 [Anthostomella pinea]|uniref:Uu.00g042600.m01.CDS01 n=1 Tax=Anthostomella pinea TaxID=933095 RepID=A0AAI8YE56_9PEZI|nr:Uu.00g042600.m01.CDS01 [Anthostomella pinea]
MHSSTLLLTFATSALVSADDWSVQQFGSQDCTSDEKGSKVSSSTPTAVQLDDQTKALKLTGGADVDGNNACLAAYSGNQDGDKCGGDFMGLIWGDWNCTGSATTTTYDMGPIQCVQVYVTEPSESAAPKAR